MTIWKWVRNVEARPVCDDHGDLLLFDIFIDGTWHGSRRTLSQCKAYTAKFGDNRG